MENQTSENATERASQAAHQKVDEVFQKAQEKTHQVIHKTTKGIDRVTLYLKDKGSPGLVNDLQQTIRQHPGKSLIAGLLVGVVVGKLFR